MIIFPSHSKNIISSAATVPLNNLRIKYVISRICLIENDGNQIKTDDLVILSENRSKTCRP
jgi:hypothetical protein